MLIISNIAIFRVTKILTLKMAILLSINVLCAALFVSSKLGSGMTRVDGKPVGPDVPP